MNNELEIFIKLERYLDLRNILIKNNISKEIVINNKINDIDSYIFYLKNLLQEYGIHNDREFNRWYSHWNKYLSNLSIDEYRDYIYNRLNHNLDIYQSSTLI